MANNSQVDALVELVLAYARREFGRRVPVGEGHNPLSHLALALNMLGEELAATTAAKAAVDRLNDRLKRANQQLELIACVDPLTDQLNRRGFEQCLLSEAHRAERLGTTTIALLIDCDDFKLVNDQFGLSVGDMVLRELARRLRGGLRGSDYLARVGGDEFLALLPATRFSEGLEVAKRLRMSVNSASFEVNDRSVPMSVSMGLGIVPPWMRRLEEVLELTQGGLRRSKCSGKDRISSESSLLEEHDPVAVGLLLRSLQSSERLRAVAQPICDVSSGEVVAWEMLSRSTVAPLEMPNDFFRVALENRSLVAVDLSCAETCLAGGEELSQERHINMFPATVIGSDPEKLLELFTRNGAKYCIEVSEKHFVGEPGTLAACLKPLRDAGVRLAMDDVGFGRTSLEALLVLEPDLIKLDRRHVTGAGQDSGKRRRLGRMTRALGTLGTGIVAMGVETEEDRAVLGDLNIPLGQGYLWGQPQAPSQWTGSGAET